MDEQSYQNKLGGDWAAYQTPSGIKYTVRNGSEGDSKGANRTMFVIHDPQYDAGGSTSINPARQKQVSDEVLSHYKTTPSGMKYGYAATPGSGTQDRAGELPGQYGGMNPSFNDTWQNMQKKNVASKMGTQRGPGTVNGNLA